MDRGSERQLQVGNKLNNLAAKRIIFFIPNLSNESKICKSTITIKVRNSLKLRNPRWGVWLAHDIFEYYLLNKGWYYVPIKMWNL